LRVECPSVLGGGEFFFKIDDFFLFEPRTTDQFWLNQKSLRGEAGAAGGRAGPPQPAVWFGSCH